MIAEDGAIRAGLAQRWLDGFCSRARHVTSAVVLLGRGEAAQEAAHWPQPGAAAGPLVAVARAAIKRECPVVLTPPVGAHPGSGAERIVSLPLKGGDGALAVALGDLEEGEEAAEVEALERAAIALDAVLQGEPVSRRHVAEGRLLPLQAPLLEGQPLAQAASAFASTLAAKLGFERVSLGLAGAHALEVAAVSHAAELARQHRLVRALAAAMQEAIDQAAAIGYPPQPDAPPLILRAHAALAAQGPGKVLTVPLAASGKCIGALSFERAGDVSPAEAAAVEQIVCLLAPLIALKQRAEEPWSARAAERLAAFWSRPARRAAAAVGLVVTALIALVPVPYRVGAPARLEGEIQRVVAAPTEGYLHAVHARPGDRVQAGQLLVELAQQDLQLESRRWEAELAQHENSAAAALARSERAAYALAQARAAEARAQLDLANSRLDRSRLVAPIDGIVIKGDLTQSLGAPVQRGEPLLTLAPDQAFRLIVEVDERDVRDISRGQHGQVALSALPGERLDFIVQRVVPVATTADGRNVFEVEGTLDAPTTGLRPGLQGVAKIRAGSAPLLWSTTRQFIEWLRYTAWRWTG